MGQHAWHRTGAAGTVEVTPVGLKGHEFALWLQDGDIPTLQVGGEVDMATAPALLDTATRLLKASGRLLVDLERITFLASSGLSALVQLRERARTHAQLIEFVASQQAVLRPLTLTGLTDVVRPQPTEREARQGLGKL
ncbi:STAS domain-containing protein [Fodinicola acaciae]|uniref:STAS domain-containing protein n=1 Tax=Fodinicola acaciae TaxID=2681555 RepID=UPI0013D79F33|nr:STAS domain-containing protein [Fodinicola acaciae]